MKKLRREVIMTAAVITFVITMCIPVHIHAQVLPIWALNPWGNVLGVGNASVPPYTIYNTAAAASPLVPFIPPLPAFIPPLPAFIPPLPVYDPYYAYGYGAVPSPALIPPAPAVRSAAATITLILPTATLVPATVPVAPAPLISTTQLFLGLLLTGGESGLFYTNPGLFWYIVGILY